MRSPVLSPAARRARVASPSPLRATLLAVIVIRCSSFLPPPCRPLRCCPPLSPSLRFAGCARRLRQATVVWFGPARAVLSVLALRPASVVAPLHPASLLSKACAAQFLTYALPPTCARVRRRPLFEMLGSRFPLVCVCLPVPPGMGWVYMLIFVLGTPLNFCYDLFFLAPLYTRHPSCPVVAELRRPVDMDAS